MSHRDRQVPRGFVQGSTGPGAVWTVVARLLLAGVLVACVLAAGCIPPFPSYSGPPAADSGVAGDGGPADGGGGGRPPDSGTVDAGPVDAGPIDAGPVDAGPIDAGPVGEPTIAFSFDEGTGAQVADRRGGVTADLVGAATFDTIAHLGHALRLGDDGRAELPTDALDALAEGTLSLWFNWEDGMPALEATMVGIQTGGCSSFTLGLSAGQLWIEARDDSCQLVLDATGSVVTAATWQHLAWVSDDSGHTMMLEGEPVELDYAVGAANVPFFVGTASLGVTDAWLGADPSAGGGGFPGRLDDVRIYADALTPAQVAQVRADVLPPAPPPVELVAAFSFSEAGLSIPDRAGSMTGTVVGPLEWIAAGRHGGGIGFSGLDSSYVEVGPVDHLDSLSSGTVTYWFRKPGAGANDSIEAVFGADHADCDDVYFLGTSSGKFSLRSSVPGTCGPDFVVETPIADPDSWNHVAFVNGDTGNFLYLNGQRVSPSYGPGNATTSHFFADAASNETHYTLGRTPFATFMWFTGEVDELRVYADTLTAHQVLLDMAGRFD